MRNYDIIEQFVQGKSTSSTCEDMVADLGTFVVVLDGVTGKDKVTFRGLTGGRFAAETVMGKLGQLPDDIDARSAVTAVSEALAAAIAAETGPLAHPPGTQLAVYSAARREIWRVGDVHARVGEITLHTPAPPTDAIATAFRAAYLSALLEEGRSAAELIADDPSWEALLPLLSRQDVFANRPNAHPLGYGVINGTIVPDRHVHVRNVPTGSEVVLASDGYFCPDGTLAEAEAELAEVLRRDPLLISLYQGFRPAPEGGSFDDRAWVRFRTR